MSIIDKARNAINARKQAADEKATAEQRARDWRSNEAQRRAERFLEKLGLPASLKATVEDGIITIRHKRQAVVEITFDWTTRSEYESGEYVGRVQSHLNACWINVSRRVAA
jgi:predicted  nucleic acid-binding Zn-ribbon protein